MADLTPEQQRLARSLIRIGHSVGASPKEIKAALETAAVEQNFSNAPGGDADSSNWRQERASVYGPAWAKTGGALNLDASARRFYGEARQFNKTGQYGSAGQLAAAVQRPAAQYRGRYQEHSSLADMLLGGHSAGSSTPAAPASSGSAPSIEAPQITDGGQAGDFTSLLSSLLEKPQQQAAPMPIAPPTFAAHPNLPQGFSPATSIAPVAPVQQDGVSQALSLVGALGGSGPSVGSGTASMTADGGLAMPRIADQVHAQRTGASKIAAGTTKFDGKIVASWIAPALQYARQHGWKGTVNSGYRSFEEQSRIYNSGVRPAAKPGTSNHEGDQYPRGAVDVSQAAELAAILRNSPYAKKLVWAGSKDPVHFSHPHGGSY